MLVCGELQLSGEGKYLPINFHLPPIEFLLRERENNFLLCTYCIRWSPTLSVVCRFNRTCDQDGFWEEPERGRRNNNKNDYDLWVCWILVSVTNCYQNMFSSSSSAALSFTQLATRSGAQEVRTEINSHRIAAAQQSSSLSDVLRSAPKSGVENESHPQFDKNNNNSCDKSVNQRRRRR